MSAGHGSGAGEGVNGAGDKQGELYPRGNLEGKVKS